MARCTCSARALELFVLNVTGISLRRPASAPILVSHRNPFGPPRARHSHTAKPRTTDVTFIPFESSNGAEDVRTERQEGMARQEMLEAHNGEPDWHAEVTILNSSHQEHMLARRGDLEEGTAHKAGSLNRESVADVSSRQSHPSSSATCHDVVAPLSSSDTGAPPEQMSVPCSQRIESRKLRLQRRIQTGRYKPTSRTNHKKGKSGGKPHKTKELIAGNIEVRDDAVVKDATLPATKRRRRKKVAQTKTTKDIEAEQDAKKVKSSKMEEGTPKIIRIHMRNEPNRIKYTEPEADRKKASPVHEVPSGRESLAKVLDTILGLEGPELKIKKPKYVDAETHKAAKKAKYDKMIADKTAAKAKAAASRAKPKKEVWQIQKAALEAKFGKEGWNPSRRLSPDTLEGIRAINASDPVSYSTKVLSAHFKMPPEAIRRILKSKFKASEEEMAHRRLRWERRGARKWEELAKLGVKPPAKWRAMGIGSEAGTKADRVPKRHAASGDSAGRTLRWDEVVADMEGGEGIAARIL